MNIFYNYFDSKEKPNYVKLRVANIFGFMETGKTVLTRKIASRLEEICEKKSWGFLYIEGRSQHDVLEYIRNNRDEIKSLDYVVLGYDDAGRFFLSRESMTKERRNVIKDYMEIRHFFEEIGFKRGIVTILFNIQFYSLLEKTIRNSPLSIWKSLVVMDINEKKNLMMRLGLKYYYFLKIITKAMFIENYRLTLNEIRTRRGRQEIYDFLVSFFKRYNVDAESYLNGEFVKRFAVVELLGTKFIIDSGNDISVPKNFVKIESKSSSQPRRKRKSA